MRHEPWDIETLPAPALDEGFAARVLRRARDELPTRGGASPPGQLRGALVPLLLLSAGGCRTALTLTEAAKIYETDSQ